MLMKSVKMLLLTFDVDQDGFCCFNSLSGYMICHGLLHLKETLGILSSAVFWS